VVEVVAVVEVVVPLLRPLLLHLLLLPLRQTKRRINNKK